MKRIAIIGAGLSGLRAAIQLSQKENIQISIWEKSLSVGGRVATRRFGTQFVNHGAQTFDSLERVLIQDPDAKKFHPHFDFFHGATLLPKEMKKSIDTYSKNVLWNFQQRVSRIYPDGRLEIDGATYTYDFIIVTSPLPQTEEMLGEKLPFAYEYDKSILFIGHHDGEIQRIEMPAEWSEKYYELAEDEIAALAENELKMTLHDLQIKKWRYARVKLGLKEMFWRYSPHILLAGESFDPDGIHDCSAAWLSGLAAGNSVV